MGTLTVKENLYFSAALRLPFNMSWKSKMTLVRKIINELGLSKCADSKVNDEGGMGSLPLVFLDELRGSHLPHSDRWGRNSSVE